MDDHAEIDEGAVGAVSDRGHRHHRNEDAFAVATAGDRAAVVICDGVSSTANPDQASAAATEAAITVLRRWLGPSGDPVAADGREPDRPVAGPGPESADPSALLIEAVAEARRAVGDVPPTEDGGYPGAPSTTLVAALVAPGVVVTAGVGDSRTYWLPVDGANRRLTVDDSWAEAAIAAGVPEDAAYAAPQAHIITEWIGGDAVEGDPVVATLTVAQPGLVVVCSDGLWNYLPGPDELAAAASLDHRAEPGVSRTLAVARTLVARALDAGGIDNVTVAVVEAVPAPAAGGTS